MLVGEIMTRDVQSCRSTDRMHAAAESMRAHDCGCMPVVDDRLGVIGIVTDRDMCMASATQGKALKDLTIESAMTRPALSCHVADPASRAIEIMRTHQIRRLPVVDESNHLQGLLALNDLARAAVNPPAGRPSGVTKDDVAELLFAICRRPVLAPVFS